MTTEELVKYWVELSDENYKKYPTNRGVTELAEKKDRAAVNRIINRYINALKDRNIKILGSFLFGSYAQGMESEWSDIDVAILTDEFIGDSFDFTFLLMKIAREIDADIEPHPFLVAEFNEENPVAVEILKTGQKIL